MSLTTKAKTEADAKAKKAEDKRSKASSKASSSSSSSGGTANRSSSSMAISGSGTALGESSDLDQDDLSDDDVGGDAANDHLASAETELKAEDYHATKNVLMSFDQYSRHLPLKALPHPSPVSEPLAVANVELPDIPEDFELRLPYQLLEEGTLSSQQLETISFAALRLDSCRYSHESPKMNAYLLGDGTGCGKGRIQAALIYHNWNLGIKRHIWVSATQQLVEDARRDMRVEYAR